MSPENLSTKAVDNPVKKAAGPLAGRGPFQIAQYLSRFFILLFINMLHSHIGSPVPN
jgi:hypothetical protein